MCVRKRAKRRAFLTREQLVQGKKHAGKESSTSRVHDPTFTTSKTLQQRNTVNSQRCGDEEIKSNEHVKATQG